ncbi:MAG: AzlC family ABC transporter permease [Firmicutes bacterium]|jgi:4-azaleucine resistance transporter AzlC|nr:AzlC family ABC transporter permease [Bacillota bacterium]
MAETRVKTTAQNSDFLYGLKQGVPIMLGYIPVGFTFGLLVAAGGLSPWLALLTSLTNYTSTGQFAGMRLLLAGAGYLEIMLTTLVINLRYLLMSLSLTQKVDPNLTFGKRIICGFGITDETFTVAAVAPDRLQFPYLIGLMLGPFIAWSTGTALGGAASAALPQQLSSAMGIALYALFIALIIPPARKSKEVLSVILISVSLNIILQYIPIFSFISAGFRIIIATIAAAGIGAWLWPDKQQQQLE